MNNSRRLAMLVAFVWPSLFASSFVAESRGAEPLVGYHAQVKVAAATRLDWVFAVANQSPAEPPAQWLTGYESTAQKYELYVPENLDNRKPAPVVMFISAGDAPAGWSQWQAVCKKAGVIFASPFGAGNSTPAPRRAHIVLDVLDDIARRHKIDPDRTYLGGFSGVRELPAASSSRCRNTSAAWCRSAGPGRCATSLGYDNE